MELNELVGIVLLFPGVVAVEIPYPERAYLPMAEGLGLVEYRAGGWYSAE